MSARPGDEGYEAEATASFEYPDGDPGKLSSLGPGIRLFYAEALDGQGQVIYNGCTEQEAGKDGPALVSITLSQVN